MKKIIFILIWFALVAYAYGDQITMVSEAQNLVEQKEYGKAFSLLNRAIRDQTLSPLQRAQALKTKAQFFEELRGDPDKALEIYKKILETKLPQGHSVKALANDEIFRLEALKKKYSKQDAVLKRVRSLSGTSADKNKTKAQIVQLRTLIEESPEYYKLVEVYYYLGLNYMSVAEYGKSSKLFEKCIQLEPSVNFYLPVGIKLKIARERWVVTTIKLATWAIIGVLLIFTVIGFYASKPWRWLRMKHLAFGLVMVALWWLTFTWCHKYFGEEFQADKIVVRSSRIPLPCVVDATPTSPGAEIAKHLFLYGLVATLGMFVFSVGTSKLRYKWIAILINAIFGLLLFASLSTVFYMRYCDQQSNFEAKLKSIFSPLDGHLYFIQAEPEPYILTDPKAYLTLDVEGIYNPYLREWVNQHYLFEKRKHKYEQQKK